MFSDDNRHISLSLGELDRLCPVDKALSSPVHVKMIFLLSIRPMNVNEQAGALSLPVSTATLNVRQPGEAGLISTEIQPNIRDTMKLCSRWNTAFPWAKWIQHKSRLLKSPWRFPPMRRCIAKTSRSTSCLRQRRHARYMDQPGRFR
ncbi:MAG: hypothetical protein IJD60_02880 [Clostridia bacterium]|nr:hypothetical protein [Clostridia bacterium]